MKKILFSSLLALGACLTFTQCDDYLTTSSPAIMDDDFVTSTPAETWKAMAFYYDRYRGSVAGGGNYNWNDPCSDAEYYPEYNSNNGRMGYLDPEKYSISGGNGQFNALFEIIARAQRIAEVIKEKDEYKSAVASGTKNDWTHLYGENITMHGWCYLELVRHFGDVPFGLENKNVLEYGLNSRFDILDKVIANVKAVEPLMFDLGEGGLNAERMTRTFANEVIAEANLVAGSFTTIRTDVEGLYGNVQFETKYTGHAANNGLGYAYVRRTDYKNYLTEAQKYFREVLGNRKGTMSFIAEDDRPGIGNPYQRGFQYMNDKKVSPESIWEVGNQKGNQSERPYSQGRPSNGGKPACPPKVFGGIRITPVFYYTGYEDGDKRWDPSCVVTGSDGNGNETMVNFKSGSKLNGGIASNKWDDNRMDPPKVDDQRKSGMNYVMRRIANTMLMLAEVDAELGGNDAEALKQLNDLRVRAGLTGLTGLTGDALKDAVTAEVKRELVGEGEVRRHEIRRGVFPEMAIAYRNELKAMIQDLETQGHHDFGNGRTISNYIWVKLVTVPGGTLTYNRDESNPALTPGWRGLYDYSTIASVAGLVKGTHHNLAIKGLFEYIDPAGAVAAALEADGYTKTDWGIDIVKGKAELWDYNQMAGIEFSNAGKVPLWFMPLPRATLTQSGKNDASVNGFNIWNGYGLPQE